MKTIDVCLSPDLIHLFDVRNKIVVVVDILRATSCMTTGMAYGVKSIKPLSSLDACREMKSQGYYIAGERNGDKVDGFDLGNSPFDYMSDELKGKRIAVTTTNGTVAIEKSHGADEIVIGSFLNISAIADYLRKGDKDVLIFCAGWKGKVNMEDSLFAGALVEMLQNDFANECDAPLIVQAAYQDMSHNLSALVQSSSHAKRLQRLNVYDDIEYCIKIDEYNVVPVIRDGEIVLADA